MQKKLRLILLVLVLALVLVGAYVGYAKLSGRTVTPAPAPQTQTAETLRDFTVYDRDGNAVAFSSLLGKPTVLNYWATWCRYCRVEFPDLQAAYEAYGDQINFVMLNLTDGQTETVETATAYVEENGLTFPVYFDKDGAGADAYEVYSYPTTLFFAADGTLLRQLVGMMTADMIEDNMRMLLGAGDAQ